MKIKNKISISFLATFVIIMSLSVYFIYRISYQELEAEISSHLETVSLSRGNYIMTYLKQQKEEAAVFSQMSSFEEFLNSDLEAENRNVKLEKAKKRLDVIVQENGEYYESFLIDKEGEVIVSSDIDQVGKNKAEKDYFKEAKNKKEPYITNIYYFDELGKETLEVSAPIFYDQSGEFIGVYVSRIEVDSIFNILKEKEVISRGSQSYLIDDNLRLISPDIYNSPIFEQKVDTMNSRNCFEMAETAKKVMGIKENGDVNNFHSKAGHKAVASFENYQNKTVFGTHYFIPEVNWCVLSEVEEAGFIDVSKLISYFSGIMIFAGIAYLILSLIISRIITGSLEKLYYGAEKFKNGDLNYRTKIDKNDEFGRLSKAFDEMAEGIKMARSQVDKKVEEQTTEIKKKARNLEEQRRAILNILEDVDEEKQNTEREKEKIDAILHSIGDAVFVVNNKMEIVMFNKIAEEISGYKAKEVLGEKYNNILRFIFEKDQKVNDEFIKSAIETGEIKEMANHTMLIRKDGERVAVADSASPLKDKNGSIKGCVVVFRDVTEEREVDKAKTEFVSLASHQLRTPLSSINWYTEMLLNGDAGKISKEQKDFLKEIYKGNQRMVDLVNALLNVSRIEMGTLAIEPELININNIVEDSLKEMEHMIEKGKIKISKKLDKDISKIKADKKLIRIVFQNLISNAIKYTPSKGSINVKTSDKDKDILIEVSDTGYGIPKKQQKNIFSKLFRADNVQEKDTEGTGLGLYIVKAIVDQAGGKIWFESEENKGTTFFIKLPKKGMKKKEGSKGLNEIK